MQTPLIRRTALLLAAVLIGTCLCAACAEKDNGKKRNEKGKTEKALLPTLPEGFDWGGEKFTIYIGSPGITADDLWIEEDETRKTDSIYDAVRLRDLRLSENYGIEIRVCGERDEDDARQNIINSIMANDGQFQAICTQSRLAAKLSTGNYLLDLNEIDSIDKTAPWWDRKMIEQCTIGDRLYWLVGDFSTTDKVAVHAIAFDKTVFRQYSDRFDCDDLYEEVREGRWTFDEMYRMASLVGEDKDGNGKWDQDDMFGLSHGQTVAFGFFNSAGVVFGKASDKEPYLQDTFWSERAVNVFDTWMDLIREDWTFDWHNEMERKRDEMFMTHHELFYLTFIEYITYLRAASDGFEFGILPYPKFDDAQEDYISATSAWAMNFLCLPINCPSPENAGYVLDALSYESSDTLKPAFYDITLVGKTTRDVESAEMLDLIFATRCYDMGAIFDFAGLEGYLVTTVLTRSGNIASAYARKQRGIENQIKSILEAYAANP